MSEYFLNYGIDNLIEEALYSIAVNPSNNPIQDLTNFFLSKVSEEDMKKLFIKEPKQEIRLSSLPGCVSDNFMAKLNGIAREIQKKDWQTVSNKLTGFKKSILNCISSEYEEHDIQEIGIIICDDTAIENFSLIYQNIIKSYFKLPNIPKFKSVFGALKNIKYSKNPNIKAISIEILRNFKEYPFPAVMNPSQMKSLYEQILPKLENLINIRDPRAQELLDKYQTSFAIPKCRNQEKLAILLNYMCVTELEDALIKINTSNHLEIVSIAKKLETAYLISLNTFNLIQNNFGMQFSSNNNFGFCTSSIKDLGTGIRITAKVTRPDNSRLEAIIKDLKDVKVYDESLTIKTKSNPKYNEQQQFEAFKQSLGRYTKLMKDQVN